MQKVGVQLFCMMPSFLPLATRWGQYGKRQGVGPLAFSIPGLSLPLSTDSI